MKRFEKVKLILDALVSGESIGGHGAFWRPLTHPEFLAHRVFGKQVVTIGDSENSALVRALKAQYPFGSDVGTTGSYFRRMPAGRPPATQPQIQYIADWIDAGCPDDDDVSVQTLAGRETRDPLHHNSYWREFDNWSMYNATPSMQEAIGIFFNIVPLWFAFAKSAGTEADWEAALQDDAVKAAVRMLSERQLTTVERFYGSPPELDDLFDSYARFGSGTLPPDALRPQDPRHQMNGEIMWFFWSAFADAASRLEIDKDFWTIGQRAILVGLIHDGLFRGRFTVQGFTADTEGSTNAFAYARDIPESELGVELIRRFNQSGLKPE